MTTIVICSTIPDLDTPQSDRFCARIFLLTVRKTIRFDTETRYHQLSAEHSCRKRLHLYCLLCPGILDIPSTSTQCVIFNRHALPIILNSPKPRRPNSSLDACYPAPRMLTRYTLHHLITLCVKWFGVDGKRKPSAEAPCPTSSFMSMCVISLPLRRHLFTSSSRVTWYGRTGRARWYQSFSFIIFSSPPAVVVAIH